MTAGGRGPSESSRMKRVHVHATLAVLLCGAAVLSWFLVTGDERSMPIGLPAADDVGRADESDDAPLERTREQNERPVVEAAVESSRLAVLGPVASGAAVGVEVHVIDDATGAAVPGAFVDFVDPTRCARGDLRTVLGTELTWREKLGRFGVRLVADDTGRVRVPFEVGNVEATGRVGSVVARGMAYVGRSVRGPLGLRVAALDPWRVRVVDSEGAPVVDASVALFESGRFDPSQERPPLERARTDGEGTARFERYAVRSEIGEAAVRPVFVLEGLFYDQPRAAPDPDDPGAELEIVQPPSGSVIVEVAAAVPRGRPDAVLLRSESVRRDREEDRRYAVPLFAEVRDGRARFHPIEIEQDLVAVRGPYERGQLGPFRGPRSKGEVVHARFESTTTAPVLRGRVLEASGAAVANRRLELAPLGERLDRSRDVFSVTTDAQGRFEVVRPGGPWTSELLALVHDPERPGRSEPIRVPTDVPTRPERVAELGDIVLQREFEEIVIEVVGVDGPVVGARIQSHFMIPVPSRAPARYRGAGHALRTALGPYRSELRDAFAAADRTLHTAEDGRATLLVPPGVRVGVVEVDEGEHLRATQSFEVPTVGPVVVELRPHWRIAGRVVSRLLARPSSCDLLLGRASGAGSGTTGPVNDVQLGAIYTKLSVESDGSFSVTLGSPEPVELFVRPGGWGGAPIPIGSFAPHHRDGGVHPRLDPLVIESVVRVVHFEFEYEATLAFEPEVRDHGLFEHVEIRTDDGNLVWAGTVHGEDDVAQFILPLDHRGAVTVASSRFRPVRVEAPRDTMSIALELGPAVEVAWRWPKALPEGVRAMVFVDVRERWHASSEVSGTLTRPHFGGSFDVPVFVELLVDDASAALVDPRWVALQGRIIEVARFELTEAGLSTALLLPDLDGLFELWEQQGESGS